MAATKVALLRCQDYDPEPVARALQYQFELLGGLDRFVKPGDTVLLKPNFIAPRSHRRFATQTHPTVILEVARLLKDFGAKPFVGDSPAWSDAATCARVLGLTEPLAHLGVPIRTLDRPQKRRYGPGRPRAEISTVALEADAVINLPKFKAHQQLVTTFAVKNMFGCVAGKRKALWHYRRGGDTTQFCELLIDIYRIVNPVLTIIDGVVAMEGQGPINGKSRPLGWLIAGADPIACEIVCCHLIALDPARIPIIETARQIGFGTADLDAIDVVGDALPSDPCSDFEMPHMAPIKFSLVHVCRSIARQILLLAHVPKAGKNKPSDY